MPTEDHYQLLPQITTLFFYEKGEKTRDKTKTIENSKPDPQSSKKTGRDLRRRLDQAVIDHDTPTYKAVFTKFDLAAKGISFMAFYRDARRLRIRTLNQMMIGWANYFFLKHVGRAYGTVDRHGQHRLRQWMRRKHKVPGRGTSHFPTEHLYEVLGWVWLQKRRRIVSWAHA